MTVSAENNALVYLGNDGWDRIDLRNGLQFRGRVYMMKVETERLKVADPFTIAIHAAVMQFDALLNGAGAVLPFPFKPLLIGRSL